MWVKHGSNYYVRKYLPFNSRLYFIARSLLRGEKKEVAGKILSLILDLYIEGYAHRDMYSKMYIIGMG